VLVLALAACASSSPTHPAGPQSTPPAATPRASPTPTVTYAEASCATLHGVLAKIEHDAVQQEQTVAIVYKANPSFPQSIIAEAWLPPGTYSHDLQVLAAAVQPYGNAPGNKVSHVTNDAGVLNADLSTWFTGASPGMVEPLPDNWQQDFFDFQADIWTLASACGVQQGSKWGVPLPDELSG
jgi:hypothetical protein